MRPGINSKERAQRIHIRKEVSVKPLQGQKDSNPHLTVLETVVLPLNYTSMMGDFSPDFTYQESSYMQVYCNTPLI